MKHIYLLVIVYFFNLNVFANECETAIVTACGNTETGTTVGDTPQTFGTCTTATGTGGAVWYTFTGDGNTWEAETVAPTAFDTKIWIFEGSCGSLNCVLGDDDGGSSGGLSLATFPTTTGLTYYIVIGGYGSSQGAYTMNITNDVACIVTSECATATVTACGNTETGTTVGDTPQTFGTCTTATGTGGAVWYTFTGDGNTWEAETVAPTAFDTKIWIFEGSCGALNCVTGDDDGGASGGLSLATFPTTTGLTYYIVIGGYGGSEGDYTMNITNDAACAPSGGGGCSPNGLTTFYATDNSEEGIMFDITAINTVTITCFDSNWASGTFDCEIYTKSGTHVGSETNAAAWALIGSATGITSNGTDNPTPIPIIISVEITAGQTVAFYITSTTTIRTLYTNGTAVGNTLSSDSNIILKEGTGKSYPFSTNYTPREFNGTVYYDTGTLPIELLSFIGENKNTYNQLIWETASEINNDYFVIERSTNGVDFIEIAKVEGNGNSSVNINYEFIDSEIESNLYYYRLRQVDFNGEYEYHKTIAINSKKDYEITVYPNPTSGKFFVETDNVSIDSRIELYNVFGELILSEKLLKKTMINLPNSNGTYLLKIKTNNIVHIKKIIKY